MYRIDDIVDYLLAKGRKANGDGVTNIDIQKIIYLAQGWHLALRGEPLFAEPIRAWIYGPAVEEVYHRLEQYGDLPIPASEAAPNAARALPEGVRNLLDQVWTKYSRMNSHQLVELTHQPGPWCTARGSLPPTAKATTPLSLDEMRAFFSDKRKRDLRRAVRARPRADLMQAWDAVGNG
ncbi:MAG: type II toxin-antitoxin system antitoxin SocA domain-containing protein [Rhodospirillaceae bacterium]